MKDLVTLPRADFEALLVAAAEKGAALALERVGLHDESAGKDMAEMRTLLDMFRDMRKGAFNLIGKSIATGVLMIMALGAATYFKLR